MYHKRADELAEVALRSRDDDDRRHYLNLSKVYERTAALLENKP